MNRADLSAAVVACEAMAKVFRDALAADAQAEMSEQHSVPRWRMPAATVWASVSDAAVVVTDGDAFLDWVRKRHPEEIETLYRVRPSWQQVFLDSLLERGDPPTEFDEPIPGLSFVEGGAFRSLSIRALPSFAHHVRAAARDMVAGSRPLALPEVNE